MLRLIFLPSQACIATAASPPSTRGAVSVTRGRVSPPPSLAATIRVYEGNALHMRTTTPSTPTTTSGGVIHAITPHTAVAMGSIGSCSSFARGRGGGGGRCSRPSPLPFTSSGGGGGGRGGGGDHQRSAWGIGRPTPGPSRPPSPGHAVAVVCASTVLVVVGIG